MHGVVGAVVVSGLHVGHVHFGLKRSSSVGNLGWQGHGIL